MRAPALADPARRVLAAAAAVAVLVLAGSAAVAAVRPPAARDAAAPAGAFSAARAFTHVEAVATRPHPVGSAAQDAVRAHLVDTLRGLGLSPEVQDTVSVEGGRLSSSANGTGLARVRNVVALLPGTASTGRVFLVAHYDSVQVGPGGNDDAAGTSAVLETARALTAGPRPRNDIVLVLTDGEEACLCGAKAFADQHPLARDGGVVVNLEARGSSGPAIMFETSTRNRRLIDVFAGTPRPVGTSFAVEIYRLLPNDTDFTAFRASRFAGLNAAYIDGAAVYHTPLDVPAAMNRDSLQHHGDTALALARSFGGRDLRTLTAGGDATYFPVPGMLVRYPGAMVLPLAVLALLAVGTLAWLARRRALIGGRRLAAAVPLALVPVVLAPVLAQLFWRLLTLVRPGYHAMPVDPYRPGAYRLAVVAIAAAVLLGWYALLRRRLGPAALAVAGLFWLAVAGLVLAVVTPGGSYLATLPALAGAGAGAVAVFTHGRWAVLAVTAGAAVAVLVLAPTVTMLFPALGLPAAGAGALLAVLLGLALLPVADLLHPAVSGQRGLAALRARRRGAAPALVALAVALVGTAVGLSTDRFDPAHPVPTQLMYALDTDDGTARWISDETHPQPWTRQYVSGDRHEIRDTIPIFGDRRVRTGPAPAAALPAPELIREADTRTGDDRTLRLRLQPRRPVRLVALSVAAGTTVTAATVGGRPLPAGKPAAGPWSFGFTFHAPPPGGVEITLRTRGTGPVRLRVVDGSDGLGDVPGFRPRPAGVGIAGSHTSELLAVARSYAF